MTQEDGCIDYNDIVDAFNWRQKPVSKPKVNDELEDADFASTRHTDDPKVLDQTTHERKKFNVEYTAMLRDLGINNTYPLSTLDSSDNCDQCKN